MTAPLDDAAEGNLGSVTDEEWRAAHERLRATGAIPEEELAFTWDPDLDPATLVQPGEAEADPAPRDEPGPLDHAAHVHVAFPAGVPDA